jgi:hypothetical protein
MENPNGYSAWEECVYKKINNKYIDIIHSRIFRIDKKYNFLLKLSDNEEVIEAWKVYGFLGGFFQNSIFNSLLIEIRTLFDWNREKITFYKLIDEIELDKKCELEEIENEIKNSSKRIRDYINENIAHIVENSTIKSIRYTEIKELIENLKNIFQKIILKSYDIDYKFESPDDIHAYKIIEDFNNMLLTDNKKRKLEKEERKKKLLSET